MNKTEKINSNLPYNEGNCEFCNKKINTFSKNGRIRRFCDAKCSNKNRKQAEKELRAKRKIEAGFINCKMCNKEVQALNKQGHRRIYCSPKCKSDGKVLRLKKEVEERRKEIIQCHFCGQTTSKYDLKKGKLKKFCSKQCYRDSEHAERKKKRRLDHNNKMAITFCKHCGLLLKDSKNKSLRLKEYCSRKCSTKYHALIKRKPFLVPVYSFTEKDWKRLTKQFGNCCAYCSARLPLALDHIIPITKGGKHHPGNFIPACKRCNSSKGSKTIFEWKQYLQKKNIIVNQYAPFINLCERHILFPNSGEDYLDIKHDLFKEITQKPNLFNEEIFKFYSIAEDEQELINKSIQL